MISISMLNELGQEVVRVLNSEVASGPPHKNHRYILTPKGVYTCRIDGGGQSEFRKTVIQ